MAHRWVNTVASRLRNLNVGDRLECDAPLPSRDEALDYAKRLVVGREEKEVWLAVLAKNPFPGMQLMQAIMADRPWLHVVHYMGIQTEQACKDGVCFALVKTFRAWGAAVLIMLDQVLGSSQWHAATARALLYMFTGFHPGPTASILVPAPMTGSKDAEVVDPEGRRFIDAQAVAEHFYQCLFQFPLSGVFLQKILVLARAGTKVRV